MHLIISFTACSSTQPPDAEPEPDNAYAAQELGPTPEPEPEYEPAPDSQPNIEFDSTPPPHGATDGFDQFLMPPQPISPAMFIGVDLEIRLYSAMPGHDADYFYRLGSEHAAQFFSDIDLAALSRIDTADPFLTDAGPRISVRSMFLTDDAMNASYTVTFYRDSNVASLYGEVFDGVNTLWFLSYYHLPPGLFDAVQQRVTQFAQYGSPGFGGWHQQPAA